MTGDDLFGKYRLEHLIGRGAHSTVFRAEFLGGYGFRKPVALKVLRRRLSSDDSDATQEFLNEARLGAAIQHPNLVEFYECGRVGERLYIAMELVDGPNLSEVIRIAPSLGIQIEDDFVAAIALQTARGLAALHSAVVEGSQIWAIHRDLKPGNILLSPAGLAKITDYGIARYATDAYQTIQSEGPRGSPLYMSPEQTRGEELSQASDVFSFGVTILELINLRPVFGSSTIEGVVRKVSEVDATDALVAARSQFPQLVLVLEDCLLADPTQRFPDGSALVEALKAMDPPAFAEEFISSIGAEVQRAVDYQREAIRRKPERQYWSRLGNGDEDSVSVSLDLMSSDTAGVQPSNMAEARSPTPAAAEERGTASRRLRALWVPWLVTAAALVVIALLLGPRILQGDGGVIAAAPDENPSKLEPIATSVMPTPAIATDDDATDEITGPGALPALAPAQDALAVESAPVRDEVAASNEATSAATDPTVTMVPISRGIRGQATTVKARVSPPARHRVTLWYRASQDGDWQTMDAQSAGDGTVAMAIPAGGWLPQDCNSVDYFMEAWFPTGLVRSGSAAHPHTLVLY